MLEALHGVELPHRKWKNPNPTGIKKSRRDSGSFFLSYQDPDFYSKLWIFLRDLSTAQIAAGL